MTGGPVVRRCRGRVRPGFRRELAATVPLEAGEEVLIDWRIARGGEWILRAGYLRVTDRRVLLLAGRWLGRNEALEIPRPLVRVRPAIDRDPVIRLELDGSVAAGAIDDDMLAFRSNDWVTLPRSRGINLRVHSLTERTLQLRELLVLALGEADGMLREERR